MTGDDLCTCGHTWFHHANNRCLPGYSKPDDCPCTAFAPARQVSVTELPAQYKPMWGIAYLPDSEHGEHVGLWQRWLDTDGTEVLVEMDCGWDRYPVEQVTDFIPLTAEQVARIEAHG